MIQLEKLEQMSVFFAARVDMYDEHMINDVEGCKEGYDLMAEYVPENCSKLLDLGCGTGLELEKIFTKLPDVSVTGIDLCEKMLEKLRKKYHNKNINLICDDYFTVDFISTQQQVHLTPINFAVDYYSICVNFH